MLHGTFHEYQLVPAMDLKPEERDQAEGALFIESELSRWMSNDYHARPILLEIYEFLNGTGAFGGSRSGGRSVFDLVLLRLKMAFRNGEIVALRIQPSPATAVARPEQPSVPAGKPVGFSTDDATIMLDFEWADDVVQKLQKDVSIVLSGERLPSQTRHLGSAERDGGVARISFGKIGRSQSITLTAKKGSRKLVLVRDQIAGDLDGALVWEHRLEELLVAEPPTDGELVAAGGPPDDAHEGPGPGEVLAV